MRVIRDYYNLPLGWPMIPVPAGAINLELNVDMNEVASKVWDRFLRVFGKDADSQDLKEWVNQQTRSSFLQSKSVQCIGMHDPILLTEIYQPTRLVRQRPEVVRFLSRNKEGVERVRQWEDTRAQEVPSKELLRCKQDLIITAGPGWGKTTLLHWLFLQFLLRADGEVLPFLITLRRTNAIADLHAIVSNLKRIRERENARKIVLLVDGYDEIPTDSRKRVSELVLEFSSRSGGRYYLTCRDYYEVYELKATRLRVADFSDDDQLRFLNAFLGAYGSSAKGEEIIADLCRRHLDDLIRHPLLLTLAAITGSSPSHSGVRNVISLIESALNTLSLRWDQGKGLTREATTPLDGSARVKLLRRLAYTLDLEPVLEHRAINIVRKQLELKRWDSVEPLDVLLEMARFYGIFVPIGERWGFVHRSLQDFLAAQFWVETGQFATALQNGNLNLDSRTAFAGSLIEDATDLMEATLAQEDGLPVFVEMLANDASFKHNRIATAIIRYYEKYKGEHYYERGNDRIVCALDQEFISEASPKFLDYLIQICARTRNKTTDTIAAYAVSELAGRRIALTRETYRACTAAYYPPNSFSFDVRNVGTLRLADIRHS